MPEISEIITSQASALLIACMLDLMIGDPDFPLHPIRLIGALIAGLEKLMRRVFPKNKGGEIAGGAFMAFFVIVISGGVPLAALLFAYRFNIILGNFVETVVCYFMLSSKSLAESSKKVYNSLIKNDIEGARRNVSMIVGRDTESLDDVGITKAAVETIAENTSDGVIAPLLYMALGGAVSGCVYKAINTMDSMVGYKNHKYINFGKVAARLDDVVNFIPSRLAAMVMILSAYILKFDGKNAAYIHRRDAHKHASPNSAQTESVAAGALRIQLAGDAYYFGKLYKKPFIGDAIRDIKYDNILQTNRLMYMTFILSAIVLLAAKFSVGSFI